MPVRSNLLQVTQLEDRTVPTGSWLDPTNLTVSFTRDGTAIGSANSSLHAALGTGANSAAWKREVLKGIQTWAAVANVNVGLVRDNGATFGAGGSIQGDSRFGDIRVGGVTMSPGTLATSNSFDWVSGTWSGDIVLNTTGQIGINPTNQSGVNDLYTVALHEAGHSLGLTHTTDPQSAMADSFTGTKTGLSAADISAIQALYGPRVADAYEGASGNGTLATAALLSGTGSLSATGELTTTSDTDYYKFVAPSGTKKFTVRLRTGGLSLLTAKVTVYDATGKVVGSDASVDPTSGDLAVRVNRVQAGATYSVKVASNSSDVFGVGRYKLSIGHGAGTTDPTMNGSGNDSEFVGRLTSNTDSETYQTNAPTSTNPQVLMIQLRAVGSGAAIPTLAVFDAAMNPLSYQVIGNDGVTLTAKVTGISQNADYFVRVAGDGVDSKKRSYALTVDFTRAITDGMTHLQNGTLATQNPTAGGTLKLQSTTLFQFVVDTGPAADQPVAAGTTMTLTVLNSAGKAVLARAWSATQPVASYSVYLAAGTYNVQLGLVTPTGAPRTVADFWLDGGVASDPTGPAPPDSGSTPPTTTTTTTDPVTGIVTTTVTSTDATTGVTTTTVTTSDPATGISNTVTTVVSSTTTTDPITGVTTTTTTTTTTDAAAGTVTTTTTTSTSTPVTLEGFSFIAWMATATVVAPIGSTT